MSRYYLLLDELSRIDDIYHFSDLPFQARAALYLLAIEDDVAWLEEIIVGEGSNPHQFIQNMCRYLLEFKEDKDLMSKIQALFFTLCDEYMYETMSADYDLYRHRITH